MAEEFKNSFGSSTSIMEKLKKAQEEKAKKKKPKKRPVWRQKKNFVRSRQKKKGL